MHSDNLSNDFYKNNIKNIKTTEAFLVDLIKSKLTPLNEQSDSELVEHLFSRIKTKESTIENLNLAGYEPTEQNAITILSDVIGIRIVTHFIGDIYIIRNILCNNNDFDIIKEKDYVKKSKPSGYRGYHIIIMTDVNGFRIKAEIQIRTVAMDCWASLEHKIRYKKDLKQNDFIDNELKKCSDDLMSADIAMEQIWNIVRSDSLKLKNEDSFFEEAMACYTKDTEHENSIHDGPEV